jgi:hypothetical protein
MKVITILGFHPYGILKVNIGFQRDLRIKTTINK